MSSQEKFESAADNMDKVKNVLEATVAILGGVSSVILAVIKMTGKEK